MEYNYFPVTLAQLAATIRFHDIAEGEFAIGDMRVTTQYLNHPVLTLGYRLQSGGWGGGLFSRFLKISTSPIPTARRGGNVGVSACSTACRMPALVGRGFRSGTQMYATQS
jgi:hypothetical protein